MSNMTKTTVKMRDKKMSGRVLYPTDISSMKGVFLPHHPPLTPLSQIPFTPGIVGFPGK